MSDLSPGLTQVLSRLKLLATDVDGVLTDGALWIAEDLDLKRFHVRDGLGVRLAALAGLRVVWISGRTSAAVARRATEIGVAELLEGVGDKLAALTAASRRASVTSDEVGFIGDDVNDLPAMRYAAVAFAPADAAPCVRSAADYVCRATGGNGVVREVCELILEAQGLLDEAMARYLRVAQSSPDSVAGM